WPRVSSFWSTDDGFTFGPPQLLNNVVNGTTYNLVGDPTVVMTRNGRAVIALIGVRFPGNQCFPAADQGGAAVYLLTTTNGTTFSAPIVLEQVPTSTPCSGTPLDHPFVDIERGAGAGGVDRVHVVWSSYNFTTSNWENHYTWYDDGASQAHTPYA